MMNWNRRSGFLKPLVIQHTCDGCGDRMVVCADIGGQYFCLACIEAIADMIENMQSAIDDKEFKL